MGLSFTRKQGLWVLCFATLVVAFHLLATWNIPLHKQIFREGATAFEDGGGSEADTHIDRMVAYRALQACDQLDIPCVLEVLQTSDRHHPPVAQVSAALWNHLVGLGVFETILINILWLFILLFSAYGIGYMLAGVKAGWVSMLMVVGAPVLLGPTRLLHQDAPMSACVVAYAACLLFMLSGGRWRRWLFGALGASVFACLAILTKWEGIMVVASVGIGAFFYACSQPRAWWKAPLTALISVCFLGGVWAYVAHVPSASFDERPAMAFLDGPKGLKTLQFIFEKHVAKVEPELMSVEEDAPDVLSDRMLYYLQAMPSTAVGLLLTLAMVMGLVLVLRRENRGRILLFLLPWGLGSFVTLVVMVTTFADDRFVHFFVTPFLILGGIGWSTLPRAWGLGVVATISFLQVWDLSVQPSLLPYKPQVALAKAGGYEVAKRTIALRPDTPYGHGTWVRPQQRKASDLDGVLRSFEAVGTLGGEQILLSLDCRGLCSEFRLWYLAELQVGVPLGLRLYPGLSGVDGRLPDYESRCATLRGYPLEQLFNDKTVLMVDALESEDLGKVSWLKTTCGRFSNPAEVGLVARVAHTIESERGSLSLIIFENQSLEPLTVEEQPPE